MTCTTCEHCDTSESRPVRGERIAGACTKMGGWFNGDLVPVWLVCPKYSPRRDDDA